MTEKPTQVSSTMLTEQSLLRKRSHQIALPGGRGYEHPGHSCGNERGLSHLGPLQQRWARTATASGWNRKVNSDTRSQQKDFSNRSSSTRVTAGEGTEPKVPQFTKAELRVELDNQPILRLFHVPWLLPMDEQRDNTRSGKWDWQKPLKSRCKN